MSDKKPNVIPTKEQIEEAKAEVGQIPTGDLIAKQLQEENDIIKPEVSMSEQVASEIMAKKTADQIAERDKLLKEQMDRAAALEAEREKVLNQTGPIRHEEPPVIPPPKDTPVMEATPEPEEVDKYARLREKQWNASYDVIPIPSKGLVYKNKKKSIKVAHLNASDENILSNENLLESGKFLEILMDRKILENDMSYNELHIGDMNAILVWLRATAYGSDYTLTLYDPETTKPFDYIVDLSKLKIKHLEVEPDAEGYFDYQLPVSGKPIKFKFLTMGELNMIENHVEQITKLLGPEFVDTATYSLSLQVKEVDGIRDELHISEFVENMPIGDSRALRKYMNEIESGVDLEITVKTPGGGSFDMFLPFNLEFYWPKL